MATNTPATTSHWSPGSSGTSFPATFELQLTEDLPNGNYGELTGMGGKLFVAPGSTYDDVAGALIEAWVKMRGSMMKMNAGAGTSYSEDWKVASIEFKGGAVSQDGPAVAGTHNAKLLISQSMGLKMPCSCTVS